MLSNPFSAIARKLTGQPERGAAAEVSAEARVASQRLSEKLGYLSAMKIFQDLSPDEMQQLERAITMVTCPAGRVMYIPGETGEVLFLLKKGRVQLYRLSPDGWKLTVKILEPMTFFWRDGDLGTGDV